MGKYILAIDQGTTSTRAIAFDGGMRIAGVGQQEFPQHFPRSGWVEHDPEDIWRTVLETCRIALSKAGISARDLAGIGITNQRETTVVWERATGKPIHNAIVWQDRRTAETCMALKAGGHEAMVTAKKVLSAAWRAEGRYGGGYVISMLMGKADPSNIDHERTLYETRTP